MSAMEQFTEAFCEKAISVFIILVPEINNAKRETREAALEAMRDCCIGIIGRVRSEAEEAPWLAEAGKKAFTNYRKIGRIEYVVQ
ncbi:hypothetical protein AB4095_04210 [Bilophila wadsworthia]|uniref:hypothetical protein n=1 Tax=Bilophila wadsworthia TaxID=35833 RepID=UPI0034D01486